MTLDERRRAGRAGAGPHGRGGRVGRLGVHAQRRGARRRPGSGTPRPATAGRAGRCTGGPVLVKDNVDTAGPAHDGRARWRWPTQPHPSRDAALVRAAARRRHGRARQDQPQRVGQHPRRGLGVRVERLRRPDPQPLRPEPVRRRLELRQRRRGGGRPRAVRGRHRDRRLDHLPGGVQRLRRDQADGRASCRPTGVVPISRVAGLPRPDGDDGRATRPRCSACSPATAPTTRRTPSTGRLAGQADRRARGRRTGATAATPTPPPSGRSRCWPPRARRSSTTPTCRRWRTSTWDDELLVMLAELRAGLERLPRHPPRRRPAHAGRRRRLQPRARRRRARALRAVAVRAGAGRARRRQPGVRRGAGPLPAATAATTASTRCSRAHELDALVTPSYAPAMPDRPGQPRGAPRLLHRRRRAIAGYPLLTVPTGLAAGLPVAVSFWGTAGQRGDPGRDRARLRGGPRPGHRPAAGADVRAVRLSGPLLQQRRRRW